MGTLPQVVDHIKETCRCFDDLPPFLTITQAAEVLQLGRSNTYELTVEWERTGGASGLPFLRFGWQKRVPRAALVRFIEATIGSPTA